MLALKILTMRKSQFFKKNTRQGNEKTTTKNPDEDNGEKSYLYCCQEILPKITSILRNLYYFIISACDLGNKSESILSTLIAESSDKT